MIQSEVNLPMVLIFGSGASSEGKTTNIFLGLLKFYLFALLKVPTTKISINSNKIENKTIFTIQRNFCRIFNFVMNLMNLLNLKAKGQIIMRRFMMWIMQNAYDGSSDLCVFDTLWPFLNVSWGRRKGFHFV